MWRQVTQDRLRGAKVSPAYRLRARGGGLGHGVASTDSKKAGTGLPSRSGIRRYPETLDLEGNGKGTIRRGTWNGDYACANVQRPTTERRRTTTAPAPGGVPARRSSACGQSLPRDAVSFPHLLQRGIPTAEHDARQRGGGSLLSVSDSLSACAAIPGSLRASRDALDRAPARIQGLCVAQLARVDSRLGNTRRSYSPWQPSDGKPIAGLPSGHSPPDVLAKECRDE